MRCIFSSAWKARSRLAALGILLSCGASTFAQRVHVVDASRAHGTDFETIGAAIANARDGDIVLIRAGVYFENPDGIDGKTLVLQAEPGAVVRLMTLTVKNLRPGQYAAVRGVDVDLISLRDNAGTVWLEDVDSALLVPEMSTITISDSEAVVVCGARLDGSVRGDEKDPTPLDVTRSSVAVFDTRVRGGNAFATSLTCRTDGFAAIATTDSRLWLYGVDVRGGRGETNEDCAGSSAGTAGGIGVLVRGTSEVFVVDSKVRGGRGGRGRRESPDGPDGRDYAIDPNATVTLLGTEARSLDVPSPAQRSTKITAAVEGEPGEPVSLLYSAATRRSLRFPTTQGSSDLPLGPILIGHPRSTVSAGKLSTAGGLAIESAPPSLPANAEGAVFFLQTLHRAPVGPPVFGPPTLMVVLAERPTELAGNSRN